MNDEETIAAAMSILGRSRSERKLESAGENLKRAQAACKTPAAREKLRQAQQARRARERAAKNSENILKKEAETP